MVLFFTFGTTACQKMTSVE